MTRGAFQPQLVAVGFRLRGEPPAPFVATAAPGDDMLPIVCLSLLLGQVVPEPIINPPAVPSIVLADSQRFPSYDAAVAACAACEILGERARRNGLRGNAVQWRYWEGVRLEEIRRYNLWSTLRTVQMLPQVEGDLDRLGQLYDTLGEEAYYGGRMLSPLLP